MEIITEQFTAANVTLAELIDKGIRLHLMGNAVDRFAEINKMIGQSKKNLPAVTGEKFNMLVDKIMILIHKYENEVVTLFRDRFSEYRRKLATVIAHQLFQCHDIDTIPLLPLGQFTDHEVWTTSLSLLRKLLISFHEEQQISYDLSILKRKNYLSFSTLRKNLIIVYGWIYRGNTFCY